jgi:hypothetical protein
MAHLLSARPLRYTCMRVLGFNSLGQKNPSELLINHLRCFRFYLRVQYIYMYILQISKDSFCIHSEYTQFHSAY